MFCETHWDIQIFILRRTKQTKIAFSVDLKAKKCIISRLFFKPEGAIHLKKKPIAVGHYFFSLKGTLKINGNKNVTSASQDHCFFYSKTVPQWNRLESTVPYLLTQQKSFKSRPTQRKH